MSENQSTTKRMTRVLSSTILVLLLQGSIAHEYRVQSSVVANRRKQLPRKPSLLRSPPSSVLSPLLQVRGGSDYYDRSNDASHGRYDDRRYEDRRYDSSPPSDNDDDRYNERDDYDDRGSRVRSFREIQIESPRWHTRIVFARSLMFFSSPETLHVCKASFSIR